MYVYTHQYLCQLRQLLRAGLGVLQSALEGLELRLQGHGSILSSVFEEEERVEGGRSVGWLVVVV